jgi:hypothetical protein
MRWLWVALGAFFWACDDGGGKSAPAPDTGGVDGALDAAITDAARDAAADAAVVDAAPPDAAVDMALPPVERCDDGIAQRAFQAGSGLMFGDTAGDFTLETLDGPWHFETEFTGCDSYVFLVYIPDLRQNPQGAWVGDQLWDTDVAPLLAKGAGNTHYFFISFEDDAADRAARMEAMRTRLTEAAEGDLPATFHFVTDRLVDVDGSVGDFATDYLDYMFDRASLVDLGDRGMAQPPLPFTFAIDRLQRWDEGGSLNEIVGRPMIWAMASYFGPFFNHIAKMHDEGTRPGVTVVPMINERTTLRVIDRTIELPPAEVMAAFDTLAFDVGITCHERNVFGCSEWDRIANIELCLDPACMERREIARWITPYWRRGEQRWIWDASPFLGLLRAGGPQTFRVMLGPEWERATEWEVKLDLRLETEGRRALAQGVEFAFGGGAFDQNYNTREPFRFTPPADARRVELVVLVSGHGQTAGDNCAEWCDHRHAFEVNGEPLQVIRHLGDVGTLRGCADRAGDGVPPGQYGNWAPGRAYWCPGLPVAPIALNLTTKVTMGEENVLTYEGRFGNEGPQGGDIALSAYVVWYK